MHSPFIYTLTLNIEIWIAVEALRPLAICRSISVKRNDALDLGFEDLFHKLRCYLMNWVPSFFSPHKTTRLICRGLHASKQFSPPNSDNIVFEAICVNLRQRRWKFLDQISPTLTGSLVSRVVREFRNSPQLALEFYNWIRRNQSCCPQFLESSWTLIHVLIDSRRYDDALSLMESLMGEEGLHPLVVLEGLVTSYDEGCGCSSPAVFDALVRACTRFGATDGAYEVIKKLSLDGYWVSIHAWNNFLNHVIKLNEIDRFWKMYKEMLSYGYVENVNTFNLVMYALCKECKLLEAMSEYYQTLKSGIWPSVVTFNMIRDGASRMGDMELALKVLRKMGFTYSILIKGLSRSGLVTEAVRFHIRILEKNLVEDVFSYNILIDYMCKSNNLRAAKQLMGSMFVRGLLPDSVTYGTLIDGHCKEGCIGSGVQIFEKLIEGKKKPNLVIYNSVINGLCKKASVDIAKLLMDSLQRMDVLDIVTYNTMINGYFISGMIDQAFVLVREMEEGGISFNIVTYNILINFLCKFGCIQQTKGLMKVMISRGMVPDFVTYTTLITNLNKNCSPEEVVALHDYMVTKGVIPDCLSISSRRKFIV
ncbi:unnamed protein product [Malus baccata var. baccata]